MMNYKPTETPIAGLPHYLYFGQNERVEELNERIIDRFHPDPIRGQSNSLEPNFTPRSVSTKFSRFPIIESRTPPTVIYQPLPNYQVETQFNPGYRGPISGFNVDKETVLRNIPFALQADIAPSTFIPSSESDLYKNYIVSRPVEQPYPKLFEDYRFEQKPHPNIAHYPEIGGDIFFNATRTQLRGVGGL
jgi:hypothetical protein